MKREWKSSGNCKLKRMKKLWISTMCVKDILGIHPTYYTVHSTAFKAEALKAMFPFNAEFLYFIQLKM
jgi:hypothetical protein